MTWHEFFVLPGRWYVIKRKGKLRAVKVLRVDHLVTVREYDRDGCSAVYDVDVIDFADVARKTMKEAAPRVSLAELRQSWDVGVWEE